MNRTVFLLLVLIASSALADVQLSYPPMTEIEKIVHDPQSYHMHEVTLKGTVRHLKELPPYPCAPPGASIGLPPVDEAFIKLVAYECYGASTFTIQDSTGSLSVSVQGFCCTPEAAIHVVEGDTVIVSGTILWDHLYPGTASVNVNVLSKTKP